MTDKNPAMDYVPGDKMEEVAPGSADDPLASDEARAAAAAASGVAPAPAAPTAPEGAGEQATPPTPATPAPTPVAPVPTPGAASEDDQAALGRLANFVDERAANILREAKTNADRVITKLSESNKAREIVLQERVRALEISGLSDEEKEAFTKRYALEDRETELKAYHEELDEQHQDILVARLSLKYSPFGVKEGDLQSKTVEEMELYCAQRKADYFEEQAKNAGIKPAPAAPATAPQTPSETPVETPGGAAPAGATAPSDTGASAPAPGEQKFNPATNREAMAENLSNIPVESVDSGKRA